MPKIDWLKASIVLSRFLTIVFVLSSLFAITLLTGCHKKPDNTTPKAGLINAKTIKREKPIKGS
jgi:hypothetical protein